MYDKKIKDILIGIAVAAITGITGWLLHSTQDHEVRIAVVERAQADYEKGQVDLLESIRRIEDVLAQRQR